MPRQELGRKGPFFSRAVLEAGLPTELLPISEKIRDASAIVFFDLDKTVLDESYNPINLEGLRGVISKLQEKGALVGIHSDSPRRTVRQFAAMFGTNGPLIYEMAGLHFPWANKDLALDFETLRFFTGFRDFCYKAATAHFGRDARILISKTRDRNREKREKLKYPSDYQHLIMINPFRLFSFGLWAEGINSDGSTYPDAEFAFQVNDFVKKIMTQSTIAPPLDDLNWDYNSQEGVVIVKKVSSSKTLPVQTVLSLIPNKKVPTYMIGDSPADYIEDPHVTTLAVANAKDALKKRLQAEDSPLPEGFSSRIAQKEYTQGVIEHLGNIARNLEIN